MKSKQWFFGSRIIFSFYWLLMSVVTAQAAPELSIGNYQLVESKRISRTVFEYSYKGTATNTGSDGLDVSATLNIDNPGITIIKNSLSFGDLATNVDIASSDTFTIRHDRSFSFSTDELQWTIQATTPPEPEPIVLNELAPKIATTGSEFLVTGTGFTTESKVLLNGAAIPTTYVSDTILKAIVPFTADELGQLLPYPAGNFAVEVNGSNSLILEVSELPENHQPRGQILNEIAETLAIDFRQSSSDFHKILPQLLTDADDDPELKAFINTLSELIDHVDSTLLNELPQSINELDNQTIDTLERALVTNRQTLPAGNSLGLMSQPAGPVALGMMTASASSAGFDGDQWLLKRKGNAEIANGLDTYNTIFGRCAVVSALLVKSPAAPAAAPILALCGVKYITGKFAALTMEVAETSAKGKIRELKLALKDKPNVFFNHRRVTLNNFDNNVSEPTSNENYIISAQLGITYRPDWCSISVDVLSFFDVGPSRALKVLIDKLKFYAAKRVCEIPDNSLDESTEFLSISPYLVDSQSRNFLGISQSAPCQLSVDGYKLLITEQNKWLVPDKGPVNPPNRLDIGTCYYKVDNSYLFSWESDVQATIDFSITRYPRMEITVNEGGKVKYSHSSKEDRTECGSSCTEYFYVLPFSFEPKKITLTAYQSNGSEATLAIWSGQGVDCPNGSRCTVDLDKTNESVPEVLVEIFDYPLGVWREEPRCTGCFGKRHPGEYWDVITPTTAREYDDEIIFTEIKPGNKFSYLYEVWVGFPIKNVLITWFTGNGVVSDDGCSIQGTWAHRNEETGGFFHYRYTLAGCDD